MPVSSVPSSTDVRAALAQGLSNTSRCSRNSCTGTEPSNLYRSEDDGATFPQRIELDTGSGLALTNNSKDGLNRELSYPSIPQDPQGRQARRADAHSGDHDDGHS